MAQDHFSSTQYNSISAEYDAVNDLPISRAIVVNIERVLGPHIRGAKVLELACGTGFFTRHLLDQDASSVVAVDISQAMVDIAQGEASKRPGDEGKCRFMVADCTAPFAAGEEGSFDLVFAAWLLNYAADEAQMTAMWKNISKHLKPGGRFVGVAPHPEEDPTVSINHIDAAFAAKYGYRVELLSQLPAGNGGYHVRLYFATTPPVDFETYFLPMSVYEKAARAAGIKGKFAWEDVTLPEDYDVVNRYLVEPVPKGYFDDFLKYPDFGVLVAEKS